MHYTVPILSSKKSASYQQSGNSSCQSCRRTFRNELSISIIKSLWSGTRKTHWQKWFGFNFKIRLLPSLHSILKRFLGICLFDIKNSIVFYKNFLLKSWSYHSCAVLIGNNIFGTPCEWLMPCHKIRLCVHGYRPSSLLFRILYFTTKCRKACIGRLNSLSFELYWGKKKPDYVLLSFKHVLSVKPEKIIFLIEGKGSMWVS